MHPAIKSIRFTPSPTQEKAAHLFEAAHDMLDALKMLRNECITNRAYCVGRVHFPNERVNMTSAALLMADKAIAKAEGR